VGAVRELVRQDANGVSGQIAQRKESVVLGRKRFRIAVSAELRSGRALHHVVGGVGESVPTLVNAAMGMWRTQLDQAADFAARKTCLGRVRIAAGEAGFSKAAPVKAFAIQGKWKRAREALVAVVDMRNCSAPVMAGVAGEPGKWSGAAGRVNATREIWITRVVVAAEIAARTS